jgi:hypothetical protein
MATELKNTEEQELRNRLRGEPGVTPEDTRSELLGIEEKLESGNGADLSAAQQAEDERKVQEKEARKAAEYAESIAEREAVARAWTPAQASAQAVRDISAHEEAQEHEKFYLRSDMAMNGKQNLAYAQALAERNPGLVQLIEKDQRDAAAGKFTVNVAANLAASELREKTDEALKKQAAEDLRKRQDREREQASQGLNSVDVQRKGREIERSDLIMPRRIVQAYSEVDGKFFAKDSNRLMFEDKGEKLATSTSNKEAIADMVAYAKAKQWESLKLTGSQEFRREAWLQAESQGIKTQGYTPKQSDLASLQELTQERSTNAITPLQDRQQERVSQPEAKAPRHDINKNQASMHTEATKGIAGNMQTLQKNPALADRSVEDLTKLAYWRGVVMEENKLQPKPTQDEALARFDKQAQDPQFLKRIEQETEGKVKDISTDRTQKRETPEHTL